MNKNRPHIALGFDADQTPEDAAALTLAFCSNGHRCYALLSNPREICVFSTTDSAEGLVSALEWFHSRKWHAEDDSKASPGKPAADDTNAQSKLQWTDDNPFCDLPHGFEFHLDYFDRFVLQTFRREHQGRFSFLLLVYWLESRSDSRESFWLRLGKLATPEDGESPGLPPTAHRPLPTSP
jgi:hypothetical protein